MSDRARAPMNGGETETLLGFLDQYRDTLLLKLEGLDTNQLNTRLGPSTLTPGALLKHLAWVEDFWFSVSLMGNAPAEPWASADWDSDGDWEFTSAAQDSPDELRALFDRSRAAADANLAAVVPEGLDRRSLRVGRNGEQPSTRWILVHMIEEYARHCGHADLIRESIDGSVGQ